MREGKTAILLCLLMIASTAPAASATSQDESVIWGVSYDWAHFENDVLNVTGVDINEVNRDLEEAAEYAGFFMDYDQILSGTSEFFVESWDEEGNFTIDDINDVSHAVTKRITELTIRHGNLADAGMLANWSDGDESIDTWMTSNQETVAIIDATYVEYVDQNLMVYGADLQMDGQFAMSTGMNMGIDVRAAGETFAPEVSGSASITFDIPSMNSEWRVSEPLDMHSHLAEEQISGEEEYEGAGYLTGDYSTVSGYQLSVSVTNFPAEDFDVDIDEFNVALSDSIPDQGVFFEEDLFMLSGADWDWDCWPISGTEKVIMDGAEVQAQCGIANPVPWGMAIMMGNSMMYAFDSGMDSLADAVGEQMETWFEEVFESSGGDEFVCDNGQEIPTHWVNDDYDDCEDGSDEGVTGEVGYDFYCDNGNVIPDYYADNGWDDCGDGSDEPNLVTFTCYHSGQEIPFDRVNDGWHDCWNGEDEPSWMDPWEIQFQCEDGSEVPLVSVNDVHFDCMDGSDEVQFYEYGWGWSCPGYDGMPEYNLYFHQLNDGTEDCEESPEGGSWDEPFDVDGDGVEDHWFDCDDSSMSIYMSEVNDGYEDCDNGADESYYYAPDWVGHGSANRCVDGSNPDLWFSHFNDGYDDCDDGTDESGTFDCATGQSVWMWEVNDGSDDCSDGSDEWWYYQEDLWQCDTSGNLPNEQRVYFYQLNDEWEDCDDGSDEAFDRDVSTFHCADGSTVPVSDVNDWTVDCDDGSDEESFYIEMFVCDDGEEIPAEYQNDGEDDCDDGSDEDVFLTTDTNLSGHLDLDEVNSMVFEGEDLPEVVEECLMIIIQSHFDQSDVTGDGYLYEYEYDDLETSLDSITEDEIDECEQLNPEIKYEKMAEALESTNLEKTMETFGEKLEELIEDNVPSQPKIDLEEMCAAMLWTPSDSRVIGIVVIADGRIMLGPSITGTMDHPINLNVEYLSGQAARDAKAGSSQKVELDQLAPQSKHDVKELYDILGEKLLPNLDQIDTDMDGTIDYFDTDDDNDGVSDWEDSEPLAPPVLDDAEEALEDAEEAAEEVTSGLPAPGVVAVISVLAAAAILISRRED